MLAGLTYSLELALRHRLEVEVQREEICRQPSLIPAPLPLLTNSATLSPYCAVHLDQLAVGRGAAALGESSPSFPVVQR